LSTCSPVRACGGGYSRLWLLSIFPKQTIRKLSYKVSDLLQTMDKLNPKEIVFLKINEVCRLATASKAAKPHVTPVMYALDETSFVIAVDYGTRKLKNVKENPSVSLVVDKFRPNKAVMIEGTCEIYERGSEYLRLLKVLFDRFEFYRNDPWGEGESPILRITPTKVVSWGFK
jgi:nitroimidazol reductase NimA-like FMN-containing flavoprotein (pyridoxamine 5'-phosphate oxidase superfamily)